MLRASIPVDGPSAHAALLEDLVTAIAGEDGSRAGAARDAVADVMGPEFLVDACAVVANFEMMTRLADGTGARLRPQQLEMGRAMFVELGLDAFPSARM